MSQNPIINLIIGSFLILINIFVLFKLNKIIRYLVMRNFLYLPGDSDEALRTRIIMGSIALIIIGLILILNKNISLSS
jgi:hypothetical protein